MQDTSPADIPVLYPLAGRRVWVAGHRGMVGAALCRRLAAENCEILTATRAELDLTRQAEVEAWLDAARPQAVFVPAAKVGGILANDTWPADFLYENLMIEANIIHAAHRAGVEKLLFLGSSCIYPKFAEQPITEEALLTGPLEPTNEWYAIAKIAGIKLCQAYHRQHGAEFIAAMPTNLYGPGDNFDLTTSHVLPALMRKAHEAKAAGASAMTIWGTGTPRREFLHVDDCADALVHLMKVLPASHGAGETAQGNAPSPARGFVNVGSGTDVTIEDLARMVMKATGFEGTLTRDTSKPDGTPRKLMSAKRLQALNWKPKIPLQTGIENTYTWATQKNGPLAA